MEQKRCQEALKVGSVPARKTKERLAMSFAGTVRNALRTGRGKSNQASLNERSGGSATVQEEVMIWSTERKPIPRDFKMRYFLSNRLVVLMMVLKSRNPIRPQHGQ